MPTASINTDTAAMIAAVVRLAPPLTAGQVDRLRVLLAGARPGRRAA